MGFEAKLLGAYMFMTAISFWWIDFLKIMIHTSLSLGKEIKGFPCFEIYFFLYQYTHTSFLFVRVCIIYDDFLPYHFKLSAF